jgi:macrodomain Ter protein organizer (MatP/YcbG family)
MNLVEGGYLFFGADRIFRRAKSLLLKHPVLTSLSLKFKRETKCLKDFIQEAIAD